MTFIVYYPGKHLGRVGLMERLSATFDEESGSQKQKTRHRRVLLNSGARTRTNAEGVEQRACRVGPEGVSRLRRIIERRSMRSPVSKSKKPAIGGFF
jgi:DNA polymerase II small subunit/DNA polymerase delta subunit B